MQPPAICFLLLASLLVIALQPAVLLPNLRLGAAVPSSSADAMGTGQPALPPTPQLTLFSADYHIAPIYDITSFFDLLKLRGVANATVVDRSLSGHCHLRDTCDTTGLGSVLGIYQCTNSELRAARARLVEEWRKLDVAIDAVHCSYPAAACEVYAPLGKPLFMHIVLNLELGRENLDAWHRWVRSFKRIAGDARNVITANSLYDLEYTYYFTGVLPEYMPSYAYYATVDTPVDAPRTAQVLLAKTRYFPADAVGSLSRHEGLVPIQTAFPAGFKSYSELRAFQAVVILPYTKSIMSFFEYYALGIPIIVPSAAFLASLIVQHGVMKERIYWVGPDREAARSSTPVVPGPVGLQVPPPSDDVPGPNSQDAASLRYWIPRSDFYTYPHITYFDSWDDLGAVLAKTDFAAVSTNMEEYNRRVETYLLKKWEGWIRRMMAPATEQADWAEAAELPNCAPAKKFFEQ